MFHFAGPILPVAHGAKRVHRLFHIRAEQHLAHRLAENVDCRPAIQPFGACVPVKNAIREIPQENGVAGDVE